MVAAFACWPETLEGRLSMLIGNAEGYLACMDKMRGRMTKRQYVTS